MNTAELPSPSPLALAARADSASPCIQLASHRSFAVFLAASLALNLIAVGVLASVITRWQATSKEGAKISWITARTVELTAETTAAGEEVAPGVGRAPPTKQRRSAHTAHVPAIRELPQALPSQSTGEGQPMRFYGSGEVDQPAEPEPDSDWNLDTASLDAFGLEALVFDMYISRTGEVIYCRIIEPRSLPDDARAALEERLLQNVLRPALRHEMAVASVRRIAISVATQGS